ncbi:MAG: hypothetical protein ABI823_07460 [Bryobacteraceae bacterium]
MSARTQGTPTDCFVWEVPDKPIAVHLSFDVVDRILPDVIRGFAAVPKRGAEVGGILLGRTSKDGDTTIVHIEDCELVPCEYKHGPSYLLSEGDLEAFDEAFAKWESAASGIGPVGFYRSHTREGLSPEPEDLDLCAAFFPNPHQVFLLIKPHATRPSTAGFFFYESGRFQEKSYLQFPFRRRELSGQGPEPRRPLGERMPERMAEQALRRVPAPEAPALAASSETKAEAVATPPAPVAVRSRVPEYQPYRPSEFAVPGFAAAQQKSRFRWLWIPLSFIFLLIGLVLGFQTAMSFAGRPGTIAGVESFSLGLGVQKPDENLRVQWDRTAPAIKFSQRGVLNIRDGESFKVVDLDTPQLQTGSIVYHNTTDVVTFRLDVYPRDATTVSESYVWKK